MKRLNVLFALTFVASFTVASVFAQDSVKPNDDSEKTTQVFEKTFDSGAKVVVKKVGREAAFATYANGGIRFEIDAFEPVERVPKEAREFVRETWEKLGEFPKKTINVEIDVTEAPDAREWAERAKSRVLYWYPKIVAMLDGEEAVDRIPDDFTIRLIFKDFDGVAYASGRSITVSSGYIKKAPRDFGLVVHETTHVAQAYPRVREVWAMEGETDYIRYYITEARSKNHWRIDPEKSKYTDSYGVTAAFYDWIVKNLDGEFIQKIHRVFRSRGSVEAFCKEEYDTTLGDLWEQFISSLNQ